jgi:positive regulator of sigma E activity
MINRKRIISVVLVYFITIFLLALANKFFKVELKYLFFAITGIMGGYLAVISSKKP